MICSIGIWNSPTWRKLVGWYRKTCPRFFSVWSTSLSVWPIPTWQFWSIEMSNFFTDGLKEWWCFQKIQVIFWYEPTIISFKNMSWYQNSLFATNSPKTPQCEALLWITRPEYISFFFLRPLTSLKPTHPLKTRQSPGAFPACSREWIRW